MTKSELLKKANELPMKPGVYMMKDVNGTVIYVGKAKILKNRVVSYFRNGEHTEKTRQLVSRVDRFDVIICASELDALLTECSLIKRYVPLYNIALKNGNGYPFIRFYIDKGFPVLTTERFKNSKGKYFGPFLSRQKCNMVVRLISKAFALPDCSAKNRRKKICLNYHIGRCLGYCENRVDEEKLEELSEKVCAVLNGNVDTIREKVVSDMEKAAENLDFERAAVLRDSAAALSEIAERQRAVSVTNRHADYIGYRSNDKKTCIFMLRIRNGYIIGERSDIFDEPFSDALLREYIERFYSDDENPPNGIYIDAEYEWLPLINEWLKNKVKLPTMKQDKELLESAFKNAGERMLQYEGRTMKAQRNLDAFCNFTSLKDASFMEIYDVSQMLGTDAVCGQVTCIDGILVSDKYRRYKVGKSFGNTDDTAFMSEAVERRLRHFADGDEKFSPLPKIIVCDGGLGQIHAVKAVVDSFGYDIDVIGFKKDSRHRTKSIVFCDGHELDLRNDPEVFAFCGRLQESVHKYAIGYHRALRDEAARRSELLKISGLGKVKVKALFDKFKTVEKMKKASKEELMTVPGITEGLALKIIFALEQ